MNKIIIKVIGIILLTLMYLGISIFLPIYLDLNELIPYLITLLGFIFVPAFVIIVRMKEKRGEKK
jgi:putative effector of murein hydrolase LrgA (UPF0299 family)